MLFRSQSSRGRKETELKSHCSRHKLKLRIGASRFSGNIEIARELLTIDSAKMITPRIRWSAYEQTQNNSRNGQSSIIHTDIPACVLTYVCQLRAGDIQPSTLQPCTVRAREHIINVPEHFISPLQACTKSFQRTTKELKFNLPESEDQLKIISSDFNFCLS